MEKTITLKNDFHNTQVNLIPKDGCLSVGQIQRARRELCGSRSCCCGRELGQRGSQGGIEIIVHPRSWGGLEWAEVIDHSNES